MLPFSTSFSLAPLCYLYFPALSNSFSLRLFLLAFCLPFSFPPLISLPPLPLSPFSAFWHSDVVFPFSLLSLFHSIQDSPSPSSYFSLSVSLLVSFFLLSDLPTLTSPSFFSLSAVLFFNLSAQYLFFLFFLSSVFPVILFSWRCPFASLFYLFIYRLHSFYFYPQVSASLFLKIPFFSSFLCHPFSVPSSLPPSTLLSFITFITFFFLPRCPPSGLHFLFLLSSQLWPCFCPGCPSPGEDAGPSLSLAMGLYCWAFFAGLEALPPFGQCWEVPACRGRHHFLEFSRWDTREVPW